MEAVFLCAYITNCELVQSSNNLALEIEGFLSNRIDAPIILTWVMGPYIKKTRRFDILYSFLTFQRVIAHNLL